MGWQYSLSINDQSVLRLLAGIQLNAMDMTPAFEAIGESIQMATDLRFESEIDPDGRPWEPLAPSTLKAKEKAGRDKILQWSGRLRQSITRQVTRSSVAIGTNLPYARIHQDGGNITHYAHSREVLRRFVENKDGSRELLNGFVKRSVANFVTHAEVPKHAIRIPARPYLGITEADKVNAIKILTRHVLRRRQ